MPRIIDLGRHLEILKGINLIVGEGLCSNIYVLGKEDAVLIDTGVGNYVNPVWPQLEEMGIGPEKVAGVIVTHAHHDHVSGLFIIIEKSKPYVYLHGLAAKYVASYIGLKLALIGDGDKVETSLWPLEVIWTPGHTEGEICLYASEQRILFSGDAVFPDGYYGRYEGDAAFQDTVKSLKRLTKLDVDIMLPGHGMPVYRNAGEHIKRAYENATGSPEYLK